MGPILKRAIQEARAPELSSIAETLERFKETIARVQALCRHPLILETKWGVVPGNPHRICTRCGLEEVAPYNTGGWSKLTNSPDRDVEEVDSGEEVYALRPPLRATFVGDPSR